MNGNAQTPQKTDDRTRRPWPAQFLLALNGNAQTSRKTKNRTKWPWGAQLFLAVTALVTAVTLLILIPMRVAPDLAKETSGGASLDFSAMTTVFVGLATMAISGIFLFMTFRIDRGTRRTAREVAEKAAGKAGKKIGKKAAENVAEREIKEISEREFANLKKNWGKYFIKDIQNKKGILIKDMIEEKERLIEKIKEMENLLNIQRDEFMKAVGEMEAVKKQVESDLKEIGQAGEKELKEIQKAAKEAINEASKSAVKSVKEAGNVAAEAVRRTGEDVRDEIRKTEREEQSQVKNTGTDARKQLDQHVDRMVKDARTKIDEADVEKLVEKLVDEKVRPVLERSPWARIFGSRPRAR